MFFKSRLSTFLFPTQSHAMSNHRELSDLSDRRLSRGTFKSVSSIQVRKAVVRTFSFSATVYCRVRHTVWNSFLESGIDRAAIEGNVFMSIATEENQN